VGSSSGARSLAPFMNVRNSSVEGCVFSIMSFAGMFVPVFGNLFSSVGFEMVGVVLAVFGLL